MSKKSKQKNGKTNKGGEIYVGEAMDLWKKYRCGTVHISFPPSTVRVNKNDWAEFTKTLDELMQAWDEFKKWETPKFQNEKVTEAE